MTASNAFDQYEEEFIALSAQVGQGLASLPQSCREQPEQNYDEGIRENTENLVQIEMMSTFWKQCEELLLQMQMEVRGTYDKEEKEDIRVRLEGCQAQHAALQSLLPATLQNNYRESLFEDSTSAFNCDNNRNDSPSKSNHVLHQIESQNATLEHARRTVNDTMDLAVEITEELSRNKETIQAQLERAWEVSDVTGSAKKIISDMQRRKNWM
eukprot:CAMPEP_0195285124 /NCGR_PEP_ID=MMETSP0707-20130614/3073_1 /TAXON_ID=33640 /ORGANISM="Asterionellopsis glacialis, Strain CCMP134" /LENGTH=211 /DNA_ID=CAMNT_0040344571 /DNA_START=55 /DNA_END=690 /DNA_ORIENTATION=-